MINNVLLGFSEVDITPAYNVQTIGFSREDSYDFIYFSMVMPLKRDSADKLVKIVAEQWRKMKA